MGGSAGTVALDMRHFDRDFALTNRLRTEGTDHLLSAGRAVGVRRFLAQSAVYGFYERTGGAVKSEEDPLDSSSPREMREGRVGQAGPGCPMEQLDRLLRREP